MTKTTTKTRNMSPIANRTRSHKNHATKKTNCRIILNRLTEQQIMNAIAHDLTDIKKKPLKPYNLRNAKTIDVPKQTNKKKTVKKETTTVSNTIAKIAPTYDTMTAMRLWALLKKENATAPFKDLCCLAKMRKYSPWPSVVLEVKGKTTSVFFFGEGTTGTVQTNEIVPFNKCLALAKKYLTIKGYIRAVRELELTHNIPLDQSITQGY